MNQEVKQDEKYISIEYETWLRKYQPMEKELEELKKSIDRSKVTVEVKLTERASGGWFRSKEVSVYATVGVNKGWNLIDNKYNGIESEIKSWFIDHKIVDAETDIKMANKQIEILKRMETELDKKMSKIPSLIKWLFNIK